MDSDQPVPVIDLRDALLCAQCDRIYPVSAAHECPSCGSRHGLMLARVIEPLERLPKMPPPNERSLRVV